MKFNNHELEPEDGESILDLLLRHKQPISYSCKSGSCQSCLLVFQKGEVEPAAQRGLKPTSVLQGYFLACQQPAQNIQQCSQIQEQALYSSARLIEKHFYNDDICRLRLELSCALYYHAGQFINLKNANGVSRSYSLASLPSQDTFLELHVRRKEGGEMSGWIFNEFQEGDFVDVQGPIGECFYKTENPAINIVLIGTGTGAAPLIGIARDAIQSGHTGNISFYHGGSEAKYLYLHKELSALQNSIANFFYHPCLTFDGVTSDGVPSDGVSSDVKIRTGLCEQFALAEIEDAKNTQLYICGNPQMVLTTSKKAFLNGVSIANIYTDPFEYKDMRTKPR